MGWRREFGTQRGRKTKLLDHPSTQKVWYVLSMEFLHAGRCPSYRDLAVGSGLSLGSVQRHLWKLHMARKIHWEPGIARGLILLEVHPGAGVDDREGRERLAAAGGRERVSAFPGRDR
jgi:hypothetical protein